MGKTWNQRNLEPIGALPKTLVNANKKLNLQNLAETYKCINYANSQ